METTKEKVRHGFRNQATADVHQEIVMHDRLFEVIMEDLEQPKPIGEAANQIRITFNMMSPSRDLFDLNSVDWTAIAKSLYKSL